MNTKKCNGLGMEKNQANDDIQDVKSIRKCISHNLKHIRKQKGLTQAEFSSHLGISRPSYASYEEKRADPPLSVVITVSNLTGIDINTLLTDELREEALND